jgi:hypothetical protein
MYIRLPYLLVVDWRKRRTTIGRRLALYALKAPANHARQVDLPLGVGRATLWGEVVQDWEYVGVELWFGEKESE